MNFSKLSVAIAVVAGLALSAPASADTASEATADAAPGSVTTDAVPARQAALADVASAIDDASDDTVALQYRPEEPLTYDEILDPDRTVDGSLSRGTIRQGSLVDAAVLDRQATHHETIERHRSRHTHYGTRELVDAVERAGRYVADRHGGSPLRVGNLGFRHGGPIPWSRSHQAGRDADLAFYAVDHAGNSVPTPDLIEFDDDGQALDRPLRFDVPRNWSLVRALLTDPSINVQWLFVSEGLKRLMLEHAVDIDEPTPLIERAAEALHQPTDAAPHADHLHLRIGCSETDRLEGCRDWGPRWDWNDWHDDALFARSRQLQQAFDNPSASTRKRALEYLHDIHSPQAPEIALQYGLVDDDPEVRHQAADIIDELPVRSRFGVQLIAEALDTVTETIDDDRRQLLYAALRIADNPAAADIAIDRLRHPELGDEERLLALRALDHRLKPRLVPLLVDFLESEPSAELRRRTARQIRRITARSFDLDWTQSPLQREHEQALDRWVEWAEEADGDRRRMLNELLADHGVDEWNDLHAVDDLIELLNTDADYKRYNLNLILSEWTGRWVPREWENARRAYEFWSNWWDRNRDRQLDDPPRPWD